jgi:hypothetical protein
MELESLLQIRSIISTEYVKPTEWMEEIEKYEIKNNEIIEIIEVYEFIIACLIKSISLIFEIDKPLNDKINEIYDNTSNYINKYFNLKPEFEPLFNIIRFNDFFKNNFGKVYYAQELNYLLKNLLIIGMVIIGLYLMNL